MLSVYMGNHRSNAVQIYIDQRGINGEYLGHITKNCREGYSFSGINNADRVFIKFQAHSQATSLDVHFFFYDAKVNETNCYMFLARPMLEECTEHTKVPSPWQNAGVTAIHGGSIVTNSITAQQIAANTITGNEIVGGTIAGKHIASKTINAGHIVSKSITSKELNVESLSAISADLGNITGGSLNINNCFKVSNAGQVEMRAAAGNVGLVIHNNQIIVYDERGNVRVKIGQL